MKLGQESDFNITTSRTVQGGRGREVLNLAYDSHIGLSSKSGSVKTLHSVMISITHSTSSRLLETFGVGVGIDLTVYPTPSMAHKSL
jgi:hypothetical protein